MKSSIPAPPLVSVAALVSLLAACGGSTVESTGAPLPSGTSEPASFPEGVFVANYSGSDANEGTWNAPLRSINAAIQVAVERDIKEVYVIGGGLDGAYPEVVVLAEGVNLSGSVCSPEHPPLKIDYEACRTTISGGTPTLIGQGIQETTNVKGFDVQGMPGVQSGGMQSDYFMVPGVGCMGRGVMNARLEPCAPELDENGLPVPQASLAVTLADSDYVHFQNMSIASAKGADGLPGENGAEGESGIAGMDGRHAGSTNYLAGRGGVAYAPADCPDAAGGYGGRGGRFRWDGMKWKSTLTGATTTWDDTDYNYDGFGGSTLLLTRVLVDDTGYSGMSGKNSFQSAAAGIGMTFEVGAHRGAKGGDGAPGEPGENGVAGSGGLKTLDPTTLVARSGEPGNDGKSGAGGAGGGGGAPGNRTYSEKDTSTGKWNILKFGGQSSGSTSTYEATLGATAAGGGGAGGSGGCGGSGGFGGQGGAASVAIYLVNSNVGLHAVNVEAGKGGDGGEGGYGGEGGEGGQGGDGGDGAYLSSEGATGSFSGGVDGYGVFEIDASSSEDWNKSASQGGRGGKGGDGKKGGQGGVGGGGAGGASIVILAKGGSVASPDPETTYTVGEPGLGAGEGETKAQDGEVLEIKSL